jgi:DNA helicase HerA-like ATPase
MYDDLKQAYGNTQLPFINFGGILVNDKLLPDMHLPLILKQFNRHGLVAGATGTGKTKSLQVLCEQLSLAGVPSLIMDMKGDISGLAMPGLENPKIL